MRGSPVRPRRLRPAATVLRNQVRNARREAARRARRERAAAERSPVPSPAGIHEREALRQQVVHAVLGLEEPYRTAVLPIPSDAALQWIVALKPEAGLDYFENYDVDPSRVDPVADLTAPVALVLDGARRIRILALDEADRPVAGVRFTPWILAKPGKKWYVNLSGSSAATVRTDARGLAPFDWLPSEPGPITDEGGTFLVRGDGYSWPDPPERVLSGRGDVELNARLVPDVMVSGRVTRPDGRPAKGVRVDAEGRGETSQFGRRTAVSDAQGRYTLSVPPEQSYIVVATEGEQVAQRVGVLVERGTPVEGLDLRLRKGALIHGLARQAGSDAEPVAGDLVLLAQVDPDLLERFRQPSGMGATVRETLRRVAFLRRAVTDENGGYAFRVGPGEYLLCALGVDGTGNVHMPERLVVGPEAEEIRTDFAADGNAARGLTGAPVRVGEATLSEYAFVELSAKLAMGQTCLKCHRPHDAGPRPTERR